MQIAYAEYTIDKPKGGNSADSRHTNSKSNFRRLNAPILLSELSVQKGPVSSISSFVASFSIHPSAANVHEPLRGPAESGTSNSTIAKCTIFVSICFASLLPPPAMIWRSLNIASYIIFSLFK